MILTIANQKGGAGKTTLTLNLAGYWASQGHRVKVIDMDPQHSALDWVDVRSNNEAAAHLFDVEGYPKESLHRNIAAKAQGFDIVVVDTPPQVAGLARSAALSSDLVLIPLRPSSADLWAADGTVKLLEEACAFKDLDYRFCVMQNLVGTVVGREIKSALADYEDVEALHTMVGSRVDFVEAFGAGLCVHEYAPGGKAAFEIKSVAKEIEAWFSAFKQL